MDKERWRKIEEVFQTVAECDPAQREACLTRLCDGDDELRREVESLLAHEVFDTFIQHSIEGAARAVAATTKQDLIGVELGPYRVTELIGEGGMGAVYAAVRDDGLFRQRVAIKVVKRGLDSAFVFSRFQAERRILAALDHPNIARMLDAGSTPDGRPYFVMEFIEGRPLNEYCQAHQLSIAARIELFSRICSAVQYAHQKLIAHRDIKPGNVLVNQEGVPKLLDFGIAKLLDPAQSEADPARTATIMRMMTPDYASPEQVRGQHITTATDIYSLGAVLYELLSGVRPHRLESYTPTEIERVICETEIEIPSVAGATSLTGSDALKLSRQLRGDLDNIVMMAMRKEPERRYSSVEQFSGDLRRYLEKLPVTARPDTLRYRAGKFVRRHRAGVVAAVLVTASLLGGLIAANYQARRAERRFQQVRKLANTFLFEVNGEVQKLPGSTKARALIINTALEYLDNLSQEAGEDAVFQLELARAYEGVGQIQGYPYDQNLGDSAAALVSFQKALAIYQHLADGNSADQKLWESLGNMHLKIGVLHNDSGQAAEAERGFRNALRVIETMQAAKMEPDIGLLTSTHYRMGELARLAGDLTAALQSQRRGLELATDYAARHSGDAANQILATGQARLAGVLLRSGELEAALESYMQALRIYQDLADRFPDSEGIRRNLASRFEAVADVLGDPDDLNLGRPQEALEYYRKSLAIAEELAERDPNDAQAKRNLALAQLWVAKMLRDSDPVPAAALYRKALVIEQTLSQTAPRNFQFRHELALAQRGLGIALGQLGQSQESLFYLRQGAELQKANFEQHPSRTWLHRAWRRTHVAIGNVLLRQKDFSGALESFQQANAINQQLLAIHPRDPHLRRDRADGFANSARLNQAIAERTQLPREQRLAAAREALAQYQTNLQLWEEWLAEGLALPYANLRRNEARQAIAECEKLLARLVR